VGTKLDKNINIQSGIRSSFKIFARSGSFRTW
jgi:hypothetical protein